MQVAFVLVFVVFVTVVQSLLSQTDASVSDPVESPEQKKNSVAFNAKASINIHIWGQCQNGWHLYKGNCYNWSGKDITENWFQAELKCRAAGGHLTSVENAEESSVLRGLTFCRNEYWLGLVNTEFANGLFVKPEGWSWWNLKQHNFTRITVANTAGLDCSFARTDGSWSNSYCSHIKRSWVCKQPESGKPYQASTIQTTICPQGWVYYGDHCYLFSGNKTGNYFHAQLHCAKERANVTTIHNAHEQAFLQAVNGCDNPFWVGLQESVPCLSIPILERCWEWANLDTVIYTNWGPSNPIKAKKNECVHSQGYWENSKECFTKMQYICKKPVKK